MASKREQLLGIMEDAAKGETKATLRDRIAELDAENARLRKRNEYFEDRNEECEHWRIHWKTKAFEALSRTGAVKALLNEIACWSQDQGLLWWQVKAREALSALEPAAPEGQQEPVAWQYRYKPKTRDEWGPWGHYDATLSSYADWIKQVRPLYARPSEQTVTEAGVEAAARHITKWLGFAWDGLHDGRVTDKGFPVFTQGQFGWGFQGHKGDMIDLARAALKAAMEAGRHD